MPLSTFRFRSCRAAPAYAKIAQRIRHDPELPTFEEVEGNRSLFQIPLYPTAPPQRKIPLETSGQSPNESFPERFPSQPSAPPLNVPRGSAPPQDIPLWNHLVHVQRYFE